MMAGNCSKITSTNSKVLFLPAASEGMFYVVNNDTSVVHYFSANGTNTINGSVAAFVIPANSSGIIACNASNNWSTIGMTRSGLVAQVTTILHDNNSSSSTNNNKSSIGLLTTKRPMQAVPKAKAPAKKPRDR